MSVVLASVPGWGSSQMAALQTDRRGHSIDDVHARCTLTGGRQDEPRPGLASHGPGQILAAEDLRKTYGDRVALKGLPSH